MQKGRPRKRPPILFFYFEIFIVEVEIVEVASCKVDLNCLRCSILCLPKYKAPTSNNMTTIIMPAIAPKSSFCCLFSSILKIIYCLNSYSRLLYSLSFYLQTKRAAPLAPPYFYLFCFLPVFSFHVFSFD